MSSASVRTVLPLAVVTGTSMLAMDLFLPAVPSLQTSLATDVAHAQATVAVFLAGLAASQLLWGEALNRIGPRRCVWIGAAVLALASLGCALAPGIDSLLAMRLLQGIAAGAATVVVPTVVRATLSDADAVRGMATIAMIEAIVPAAGPVLGAALLVVTDWRATFWVIAAATLLALPFGARAAPKRLPGLDARQRASYKDILSNGRFLRLALSHALAFGALLTFVAGAPQLLHHAYGLGASAFATLQVLGVLSFMAMASQSARFSRRLGLAGAVRLGALFHVGIALALLGAAGWGGLSFAGVAVFWCAFCGGMAVRGPAAFTDALALPASQMGRASAMMTLAILLAGALGTQLVAPFMGAASAMPLAVAMLVLCLLSLWVVTPYPPPAARA